MPNRRAHDHIGQIRQKLGIRIGADAATLVIENLKKLADADYTIQQIDKIVSKVINDPRFRTTFLKNPLSAAKNILR
ncbi:MAG: hypothetical protein ACTSPY_18010 [Candidatus Helarchaeota archaeon]